MTPSFLEKSKGGYQSLLLVLTDPVHSFLCVYKDQTRLSKVMHTLCCNTWLWRTGCWAWKPKKNFSRCTKARAATKFPKWLSRKGVERFKTETLNFPSVNSPFHLDGKDFPTDTQLRHQGDTCSQKGCPGNILEPHESNCRFQTPSPAGIAASPLHPIYSSSFSTKCWPWPGQGQGQIGFQTKSRSKRVIEELRTVWFLVQPQQRTIP